jgi:hypothetical protein
MIRLSVFYPVTEGATFDHEYYRDHHVPLAVKTWFDSQEALAAGMSAEGTPAVLADVANYTSIAPVLQTSEIVS